MEWPKYFPENCPPETAQPIWRIHSCIFHFDIKDGKIWLQENNTDIDVGEELEELGISKQEIVIAFHYPSLRQYSEYAAS